MAGASSGERSCSSRRSASTPTRHGTGWPTGGWSSRLTSRPRRGCSAGRRTRISARWTSTCGRPRLPSGRATPSGPCRWRSTSVTDRVARAPTRTSTARARSGPGVCSAAAAWPAAPTERRTRSTSTTCIWRSGGARGVLPEHEVTALTPLPGGGYEVAVHGPGGRASVIRARRVVLAAGVLGTLELLLRCRDDLGTLPRLSPRLGKAVRTNSEAVTAVLQPPGDDLSRGPSISSDFHPDERTHVTQNRYVGGGHMRWMLGPLVDGAEPVARRRAVIGAIARSPLRQLRLVAARDLERRLTALTVMQDVESEIEFRLGRSPARPWRRVLRSRATPGRRPPSYLEVANRVTREFAAASGGRPLNLLPESAGGLSVTAHVLGGAAIGPDPNARSRRRPPRGIRPPRPPRRRCQRDPRQPRRQPEPDDHRDGRALRRGALGEVAALAQPGLGPAHPLRQVDRRLVADQLPRLLDRVGARCGSCTRPTSAAARCRCRLIQAAASGSAASAIAADVGTLRIGGRPSIRE